ncbi:DNA-directed RNA polymerase [Paenibacillus sp. UMB4589-SE434]|uniref:DNA-directed RNA polymerase n=1 Tax=Paenibacillus sp. UMB4589-SE434 TaxID=3046314 RepID=UPI00254FF36E|nr:DNA-directed RNA polymerase [Paenibacillus sp. UMB4589-SE434]MDK8179449.1 DNA-directed RNA polymerase [Paenibacillus sp. UMB4589-SE434]
MRITTFIAGMAVGTLAGMYMADRRSLSQLQSKLQIAGDMMSDVVGKAKGKVMESAFSVMGNTGLEEQLQDSSGHQASHTSHNDSFNLDRVKELIERDPEVKRQVDAILRDSQGSSTSVGTGVTSVGTVSKTSDPVRHKPVGVPNSH